MRAFQRKVAALSLVCSSSCTNTEATIDSAQAVADGGPATPGRDADAASGSPPNRHSSQPGSSTTPNPQADGDAGGTGAPLEPASEELVTARRGLFDWLSLPLPLERSYWQYSTRDPEQETFANIDANNKDFNNFLAVCGDRPSVLLQTSAQGPCEPGVDGYVLAADDDGPGFVSRIWFASGGNGFVDERIRIYVDDLQAPVYDAPLQTWSQGVSDPFVSPLTLWTSNAIVSYVPIAYQRKLRVLIDRLNEAGLYYSQTNVQRGSDLGTGFAVQSAQALQNLQTSVHAAEGSNLVVDAAAVTLAAGETAALVEQDGRGTLTQLMFRLAAAEPASLRALVLRMYWEQDSTPAVDMPLSAFFGAELSVAEYATLPLAATRVGEEVILEANWPLPYFEQARITLENTSDAEVQLTLSVSQDASAPPVDAGHFHASYQHSSGPFLEGARYDVATLDGHGKYVGTLLYMQGTLDADAYAHYPLGFLEGDERIVIDDEVAVLGTGTEDFFDAGYYWGSRRFDSPFATLISRDETADGGSVTAARWHILTNSMEFKRSLALSFEYGADRPQSATDYASVAYYYLFD